MNRLGERVEYEVLYHLKLTIRNEVQVLLVVQNALDWYEAHNLVETIIRNMITTRPSVRRISE